MTCCKNNTMKMLDELMSKIDMALGISTVMECTLIPEAKNDLRGALFEAGEIVSELIEEVHECIS